MVIVQSRSFGTMQILRHGLTALFDVKTGARIDDACIPVTVAELGLGGVTKILELFPVGDAVTFSGHFKFDTRDLYEIQVRAALPDGGREIERSFDCRHQ